MGRFHSTFPEIDSADPSLLGRWFLEYDPDRWDACGGALDYLTDERQRLSLIIVHWRPYGFVLNRCVRNLDTKRNASSQFAVADVNALAEFVNVDDLFYPVGCFLAPLEAWRAVEDFLATPERCSSRVAWIDEPDIAWPPEVT